MKTKGFTPIIILIVLIILGSGGFFVYYNYQLNKKLGQVVSTPTPSTLPTIANPTLNWKVYKSSVDNYEFKIPQDWKEIENFEHLIIFQSSDGLMKLTGEAQKNLNPATGKPYLSLDEFIGLPYIVGQLTVNGQDARQPLPRAGSENIYKVYFFSKDLKSILSIELQIGDGPSDPRATTTKVYEAEMLFNRILSTFKFVG